METTLLKKITKQFFKISCINNEIIEVNVHLTLEMNLFCLKGRQKL